MSHLIPTKAFEEDPDAWWRKTDHALNRNLGKPGNQYSGRSVRVGKDYNVAYNKVGSILSRTGTKDEIRRAAYYEKPSERKTRLNSERWRRRFQEMVSTNTTRTREALGMVAMLLERLTLKTGSRACAARPDDPRPQVDSNKSRRSLRCIHRPPSHPLH